MNVLNWIVPLVSIVVAIVTASFSYYFTKKLQARADERRLKEEYYQNYINAISKAMIDFSSTEVLEILADSYNKITLVGSSFVVKNALAYHAYIGGSRNKSEFSADEHDKLLTALIKSMRLDLFNDKNINNDYPTIRFIRAGNRK